MKKIETKIPGVVIIEPDIHGDHRGYFMETYSTSNFHELGIDNVFVQDNMSFTAKKGTLRGLHFQNDPMAQAKLVSCTKGTVIDFFSEKELELLLNQPNQSNIKDRRNLAMMITLYDTGARIQELLNLRIKDISLESSPHIAIYGKGKKMRIVPIMDKTVKHLKRYLDDYDLNSDDYAFFTLHHGERTKMNPDTVQKLIDRYCIMANNVDSKFPRHIYCHMFRHSRAMHLYRNGMPLPLVSEWLGHAQINTTREFYANADTEMKRKAINAASPVINIIDSSTNNYDFDDEELLKKLYSLK